MHAFPSLPQARDNTIPPVALLLQWLAALAPAQEELEIFELPHLNGCMPGLLRLGGIPRLSIHQRLPTHCFVWKGQGGGRVLVNGPTQNLEDAPLHHGPLPSAVWSRSAGSDDLKLQVELARLDDAMTMHGIGSGASWNQLLAMVENHSAPSVPALLNRGQLFTDGYGAWNPLPFARRGVVTLAAPADHTPWALLHSASGSAYPVQLVEGPVGRELLVELPLPALGAQRLEGLDEPAPGVEWEVSAEVLDNGRVRAEFDVHGQVERLCFAGRFVEISGPLVHPLLDGIPVGERPAEIRILEDGPVRARVVASRETAQGVLHVTYTVHANEALLHVALAWDGGADVDLVINHATSLRHSDLRVAGEMAAESRSQSPSICDKAENPVPGCHWAMLEDGNGGGLALFAQRPLAVHAVAGHLRLPWTGQQLAYALGDPGVTEIAKTALSCAVPLRSYHGDDDLASPLRLVDGPGVAPLWIRRVDGAVAELLLSEQLVRRSRLWIYPATRPSAAWRSDVRGKKLGSLAITPEGDGIQVDLHPGELALVRWR